jgi:uncharacterized BrkB/YihY/UPF0761 family membrane protein
MAWTTGIRLDANSPAARGPAPLYQDSWHDPGCVRSTWHSSDLVLGAFVTAVLFAIGKSLIEIYLGRAAPSSPYGAAGALIVLMCWTYYSAQIFLFGAELTKAIADQRRPPDRSGSKRT